MFTVRLQRADHTKDYSISTLGEAGWEVKLEEDCQLTHRVCYHDWHRVERALARASELEAMVRGEVAALERTYSDNEVRIRGLLQDLANQRDTLVGQAEQVRSAINNVHIDLTQDL